MAALTWRDVAAPNFAGVNQGFQTANATLDRALSGLSEGLKQFQTDRQAGIDGALLGNAMRINDAEQYQKALTDGSLLAGVDLSKVSPKVLQAIGSRASDLLNQASTRQNIATSVLGNEQTRQNMAINQSKQDRTNLENLRSDNARASTAQQLGFAGPQAELSIEDQQKLASTRSTLASQQLGRAATSLGMDQTRQNMSQSATNFKQSQQERDERRNAEELAGSILLTEPTREGARQSLTSHLEGDYSSNELAMAGRIVEKNLGNLFEPLDAPAKSVTGAAGTNGQTADDSYVPSKRAADALNLNARRVAQNSTAGAVADVERTLNDTRSVPEIAQEIGKLIPEADIGKINGRLAQARSDNPDLSAAEIGAAMTRSLRDSGAFTIGTTTLGDGTGYDNDIFKANLKDLRTGKADYMSAANRKTREFATEIKKADKGLTEAVAELQKLERRKESQPEIDTTKAQERVFKKYQELDNVIKKQNATPEVNPRYEQEAPKSQPSSLTRLLLTPAPLW